MEGRTGRRRHVDIQYEQQRMKDETKTSKRMFFLPVIHSYLWAWSRWLFRCAQSLCVQLSFLITCAARVNALEKGDNGGEVGGWRGCVPKSLLTFSFSVVCLVFLLDFSAILFTHNTHFLSVGHTFRWEFCEKISVQHTCKVSPQASSFRHSFETKEVSLRWCWTCPLCC
jgi:hypothetical protein